LTPTAPLAPSTPYSVTLGGTVLDAAGNAMAPINWGFTTAAAAPTDTTAPTVKTTTPAAGATGVPRGGKVTVTFSEPVTGVSRTTVTLTTSTGASVAATVGYNAATHVATLNPKSRLQAGQRYQVTVTNGIKDAAGNPLAAVNWTFTTGQK
jgi:methionine-rich copper-binding protein CopC